MATNLDRKASLRHCVCLHYKSMQLTKVHTQMPQSWLIQMGATGEEERGPSRGRREWQTRGCQCVPDGMAQSAS